jgi:hypothetical protein
MVPAEERPYPPPSGESPGHVAAMLPVEQLDGTPQPLDEWRSAAAARS